MYPHYDCLMTFTHPSSDGEAYEYCRAGEEVLGGAVGHARMAYQ